MLILYSENWPLHVLRGILAIVFGLMALLWPGLTLGFLIVLFGIYVVFEGILAVVAAGKYRKRKYSWLLLMEGVAGIAAGVFSFLYPLVTAMVLLIFIAAWAIITGIFEIAAAVQLRKEIKGEWILGSAGILSIILGILLLINPGTGALAIVWLIGLYAVLFGFLLVWLGMKIRKMPSGVVPPFVP